MFSCWEFDGFLKKNNLFSMASQVEMVSAVCIVYIDWKILVITPPPSAAPFLNLSAFSLIYTCGQKQ